MDPYLEGSLWTSFHHDLTSHLSDQIVAKLPENYVVLPEKYLVVETIAEEDQRLKPDVMIDRFRDTAPEYSGEVGQVATPTLFVPNPQRWEYPKSYLKILDTDTSDTVTVIEILSPGNKEDDGLKKFRKKRDLLHESGVHFLEIDLLRRGKRTLSDEQLHEAAPFDYMAALYRANSSGFNVWTFGLKDSIPLLPVPLLFGDTDLTLDTQQEFEKIYAKRKYHKLLPYGQPAPRPVLSWRPGGL